MRQDTADFTQGRIFLPLLKFSLPILMALVLQTAYGANSQPPPPCGRCPPAAS